MNFSFRNQECILEDPSFLNALFKFCLLQQESTCEKGLNSDTVYQPDPQAVIKILSERGSSIVDKNEILARLPKKNPCDLDPNEKLKRMVLEDSINGEDTENQSGVSDSTTASTPSIRNSLQERQMLMSKIDELNGEFVKGGVFKSDQDADIREMQRLTYYNQENNLIPSTGLNNHNGNINGNSQGNLSSSASIPDQNNNNAQGEQNNLNNHEGLKFIQKRSRRPRADQMVKKVKEDTKNLLRNYGNAQSRFVLNNIYGKRKIDKYFDNNASKIEDFKKWVAQLKLENFEQFKNVWHVQKGEQYQEYKQLFREICFDFYENHASVYVLGSQMRSEDTRKTHIKYICRFLEGIVDPNSFFYFKKN